MKDLVLATIVSMALLMMSATVSMAIDTVPLPEKPTSTYSTYNQVKIGSSDSIMIGTWPTPELPEYEWIEFMWPEYFYKNVTTIYRK